MKRLLFAVILFLSAHSTAFSLDECPQLLAPEVAEKKFNEWRVKTLKNWDRLLTWTLSPKIHSYVLSDPSEILRYHTSSPAFEDFNKNYGYFSPFHPIVGMVTTDPRDFEVTQCLLESVNKDVTDEGQKIFSLDEILAKVMAYRKLEVGMEISLKGEVYRVDRVIDLWRGMPAFGLIPLKGGIPIILFRGTDLSINTERGWASILSDLDITGPGLKTFMRAKEKVHEWLKEMNDKYEPPRAIGFSLGGSFVLYTLIYFPELLSQRAPSIAFNPPGLSEEMLEKWNKIEKHPPHKTYVNLGDIVSQLGFFITDTWVVSLDKPMQVIQAHTTLMCSQPLYQLSKTDVERENRVRGY